MAKKMLLEGAAVAGLVMLAKEAIKAGQDQIKGALSSLDEAVHDNAVQCLMHADKFGDTSLMRRLLVEVLGVKTTTTGYRTQGLINWMRKHSPMELKGDTINLSGLLTVQGIADLRKQYPELEAMELVPGDRRPFLIDQANRTHFVKDPANAERVYKPVFTETLLSPVLAFTKKVNEAVENTVNGEPVDPKKYFFDGVHMDKLAEAAERINEILASLPKDDTLEIRRAQARVKDDQAFIEAATKTAA